MSFLNKLKFSLRFYLIPNFILSIYNLLKNLKLLWFSNVKIYPDSKIYNTKFGFGNAIYNGSSLNQVMISDYSYVAHNTKISRTSIGKFCSIGPNCCIGLGTHPTSKYVSTHPIFFSTAKQNGLTFVNENKFEEHKHINIGNDVWIGTNCTIIDGVNIADGTIIAAGSVVTKDTLPYSIVGGVPAKKIKDRFKEEEINELLNSKWWDNKLEYFKKNNEIFSDITLFSEHLKTKIN